MVRHAQSEEASKQAFVLPLLRNLGYDTADLTQVIPEYHAGVFQEKGPRVDYAIVKGMLPIILIECKSPKTQLSNTIAKQLFKYFIATEARVGILTNGLQYRFYTDLDKPNKMDSTPFMQFDLLEEPAEKITEYLQLFTHSNFNIDSIIRFAQKIKYTTAIKNLLSKQLVEPSEKFISFILSEVYNGMKTRTVKESFAPTILDAFREFIDDCAREDIEVEPTNGTENQDLSRLRNRNGREQGMEDKQTHGTKNRDIEIASNWISLAECLPHSKDLPITVRLWSGDEKIIKYWTHLPRIIAEMLHKEKLLTYRNLPYTIGEGKSFIINGQPIHRDGSDFAHNRTPLGGTSSIYMFVIADPKRVKKYCVRLLKDFHKNPKTDLFIKLNHDKKVDI